jgi:hypothetical protein
MMPGFGWGRFVSVTGGILRLPPASIKALPLTQRASRLKKPVIRGDLAGRLAATLNKSLKDRWI